MSEDKDSVDEAWDDVPGAEPKPAEPAKPAESASKPPTEPPKPASTPPRPSSSAPPRPGSNPPRAASSAPPQVSNDATKIVRETASTRPEGLPTASGKRTGTLIGIPAPVLSEKQNEAPDEKPSDKPSDQPAARTSDKPPTVHDAIPAGKRTLIGIAAPVVDQKTPPEPWRASQAPKAASSPPAEPLPETRREEPSAPTPTPPATEEHVSRGKRALSQTTRKETPEALAAVNKQARTSRGRTSSAPPDAEKSSRLGPILLVAILGAAAIWFLVSKQRSMSEPDIETVPAPTPQAEPAEAEKPPEPVPAPAPEPVATPTPVPEAEASAAPYATPPSSASAVASAEKAPKAAPEKPAATAEPAPPAVDSGAVSAEGTRVVIVKLSPPDAELFYKGKSVGKSPVRIELAPGERKRSFEVGRPGWVTRKLTVDGSQPEVFIGLRPESPAAPPTE